jgi:energy-coupling factor transport system permease protein
MSGSFDLYVPRDSWLHRMDPRAKLWAVLLASIVALGFRQIALLAGLLALTHVLLLSAQVPARRLLWLWTRLAPLLVMILILQPIFSPGPGPNLLDVGPLRLTVSGMLAGLGFALRAATLAFVAALLLLTTNLTALVQSLVKLGLPYPWGLTVGLAIRYLPTTNSLFLTISDAQQARGWIAGQGSFLRRARSYLPILVATMIAALRLSDSLGLALAARGLGYTRRRTTLSRLHFAWSDWLAVVVVTALFAGTLLLYYRMGFATTPGWK